MYCEPVSVSPAELKERLAPGIGEVFAERESRHTHNGALVVGDVNGIDPPGYFSCDCEALVGDTPFWGWYLGCNGKTVIGRIKKAVTCHLSGCPVR